jgi:hypothetical protein
VAGGHSWGNAPELLALLSGEALCLVDGEGPREPLGQDGEISVASVIGVTILPFLVVEIGPKWLLD